MKTIVIEFFILCFFFMVACHQKQIVGETPAPTADTIYQTVPVPVHDTVWIRGDKDSLQQVVNDLRTKLFISNYKIERVRYYMKICQHRPSQTKFLVSWIHRAIN
jgi:hypothetical protein